MTKIVHMFSSPCIQNNYQDPLFDNRCTKFLKDCTNDFIEKIRGYIASHSFNLNLIKAFLKSKIECMGKQNDFTEKMEFFPCV